MVEVDVDLDIKKSGTAEIAVSVHAEAVF